MRKNFRTTQGNVIVRRAACNTFIVNNNYNKETKLMGFVRLENQLITEQLSIMVQSHKNYYLNGFLDIQGIGSEFAAIASTFDKIWCQNSLSEAMVYFELFE